MKLDEKRRALPRRRITVTLELTPEEYEDLVTAVIAKRQAEQDRLPLDSPWRVDKVIDRAHPLVHHAVEFDVRLDLGITILKYIGHEGRPTLAAQYQRMNAELKAEKAHSKAEELVRAA
jgi:hypothetical protein